MSVYPEFANLINDYLAEQDRSPSWLARRLGVNHGTVSRWLNQQTRPADPETVLRIADVLGVYRAQERQKLLLAAGYGYLESHAEGGSVGVAVAAKPSDAFTPPFMAPALPPHGVVGRDELLARLGELLAVEDAEAANVAPAALHGMGGIGKTTLAIALARQAAIAQRFPDGVLWVTLGPTPVLRNLLDDWGEALGEKLLGERDEEACRKRLAAALYRRRMLLVVDDVWEAAHGQAFGVAGPHCCTLYTTREAPAAYALATRGRTLQVDVLSPQAALALLARLAPEVIRVDAPSAERLCERLEYLPLALTLAGRLLAQEADVPTRMQRLLGELIERRAARLQLLETDGRLGLEPRQPVSLQAILGMSVERLSRVDQERFAILSAFGGEPLTWEMAAAAFLWECPEEEAEATLAHLIQRGLVMQRGAHYWMHALLADYAAEMLTALD